MPSDNGQQTIGPELRAQVQFWRSQALAMKGDDVKARAALAEARRVVGGIQAGLPATVQQHFMARRDIHAIVG